jgi:flagellar motor switch protein FliG
VLNNLLDGQNLKRSKMGGVRTAAEIINLMKTQQEEAVITAVREFDGELAQKIIDEMFLFENLVEVDDRSIQRLLQEVDSESLLIALKGAEQPLRESSCATCLSVRPISCATTLPTAARFVCLRWKTNRKPFCLLFVVWRKPARW